MRTGFGIVKIAVVGCVVLLGLYARHGDIAAMIVEERSDAMALPMTPLPRNALGPLREFAWHNVMVPVYDWLENR